MNLCFAYPNEFSYSETFIRDQIEGLSPECLIYEGWYPSKLANGHSFLPFPLKYLFVRGTLRNLFPKVYHRIYSHLLAEFLKKNQINVILAQYGPMGAAIAEACKLANVAMVVHFHGFDAYHYETVERYRQAYQKLFMQANAFIAVSKDMVQQLTTLGANPQKIYYNSCSVSIDKFDGAFPDKMPPVFAAVGRFAEKKGPDLTVKAFAEVIKVCPEAKLVMVGVGELLESTQQLVSSLGINHAVDFKGALLPDQIVPILQNARAFVQHSKRAKNGDSEGTPVSVLEASATGLPIVSTLHAGIKDAVIHGETGFLVPEGDVEGMAKYMIQLAQEPELAARMGKKAREHMIKHYSMAERTQQLREILERAAQLHS